MRERVLYKNKGDLYQLPSGNMWGVTVGESQPQAGGYPGPQRMGIGAPRRTMGLAGMQPGGGQDMGGLDPGWGQLRNQWAQARATPSYFNRQVGQMPLPGGLEAYTPQGYGGQPAQQPMGLAAHAPFGYGSRGGDVLPQGQGLAAYGGPRAQYGATMANAQYQGATPGMVAYSGGMRPGFLGAAPQQGGGGIANPEAWAMAHGLHYNTTTGGIAGNSPAAGLTAAQVQTAGIIGRSPYQTGPSVAQLATNKAAYKGLAKERADASRQQVLSRVATRERNSMGLAGLGADGQAAPNHIADLSAMATQLAPLVAAGGMTQEMAGGLLKAEMQKRGIQLPTEKKGPLLAMAPTARQHMTQAQWKDFLAKPAPEQHGFLLSIGVPPDVAKQIIKEHQPTSYGLGAQAKTIGERTWKGIQAIPWALGMGD